MKYYIPKIYLSKLEKIVKSLQKKTDVKFEYDEDDIKIETFVDHTTPAHQEYKYLTIGVELEVNYKVGDYELVAELEHTVAGNIIRQINFEHSVPEMYRTTDCYCEHCQTKRKRNNTFLLVDKNNNFKQVGKSCLNDYTGVDTISIIEKVNSLSFLLNKSFLGLDEEFMNYLRTSAPKYEPLDYMANLFYQIIQKDGYSKERPNPFANLEDYKYNKDLDDKVEKILDIVNTEWYNDASDYCHNVKVMLKLGHIERKHWKLLLSYINSAMFYIQKQEQRELEKQGLTNEYLGNVGDKVEFEVKDIKILYTKHTNYSYRGEESYVYRILTTNNNIVIWNTQLALIKNENPDCFQCNGTPFTKIKATIKTLSDYKGEKQTVVTRGKTNVVELPKKYVTFKGKEYLEGSSDLAVVEFLDYVENN